MMIVLVAALWSIIRLAFIFIVYKIYLSDCTQYQNICSVCKITGICGLIIKWEVPAFTASHYNTLFSVWQSERKPIAVLHLARLHAATIHDKNKHCCFHVFFCLKLLVKMHIRCRFRRKASQQLASLFGWLAGINSSRVNVRYSR